MTVRGNPELALGYLSSMWADLRGAAILDENGARLAGDGTVAVAAAGLLLGAASGQARRTALSGGVLYAARSTTHTVAVLVSTEALEPVVVCDLLAVLDDLAGC